MNKLATLCAVSLLLLLLACDNGSPAPAPAPTVPRASSGPGSLTMGPDGPVGVRSGTPQVMVVLETVGPGEMATSSAVGEVPAYNHVLALDKLSSLGGNSMLREKYATVVGVNFTTNDDAQTVHDWYSQTLTTQGWQAGNSSLNIMQFSKQGGSAIINILISKGKLHTVVRVDYASGPLPTSTPAR